MEIKGSKVKTPKITFPVVDACLDQKFCGIKIELETSVDSKINIHTERR